jgi:hypothetical protein
MSTKTFQAVCAALWGPQKQSKAARQLGVGRSSIVRYDSSVPAVPKAVLGTLAGLLEQRLAKIEALRPKVRAASKVAS